MTHSKKSSGTTKAIFKSLVLTIICCYISSFANVNEFFYCVVFAPIIEEWFKKYTVVRNYQYIYTLVFAIMEGLLFIVAFGLSILPFRLFAIFIHLITTYIQTYYHKRKKLDLGYKMAVFCHSSYNFLLII